MSQQIIQLLKLKETAIINGKSLSVSIQSMLIGWSMELYTGTLYHE